MTKFWRRPVQSAVKKASKKRLLADFRSAVWIIQAADTDSAYASAWFTRGAIEAEGSLTVKAALLTAFGE